MTPEEKIKKITELSTQLKIAEEKLNVLREKRRPTFGKPNEPFRFTMSFGDSHVLDLPSELFSTADRIMVHEEFQTMIELAHAKTVRIANKRVEAVRQELMGYLK